MAPIDHTTLATVLSEYASGSEPLDTVARRYGTTGKTLRQRATEDAEFGALYARARIISAGALEDEALTVARASTAETYGADRVLIDTLKWAAAKRYPKEYGDRVTQDVNVIVEQLHLDALRAPRVTATATLANPNADTTLALPAE